jgi:hypothetical protein
MQRRTLLAFAVLVLTVCVLAARQPAAHAMDEPVAPMQTSAAVYLPVVGNPPSPTPVPTATATPEPTATPTPTLAPTPLPAGVYGVSQYGYLEGTYYHVFAELINGNSNTVCFVKVVARFYDTYGTFLATDEGYTMMSDLAPQQKAPVHIMLSNAPSTIAYYSLDVTWRDSCNLLEYRDVTILNQNVRDDYGAEVFGEVRNDNPQTIQSIKVVVTFYDGSGQIRYADFGYLSGNTSLAPGQIGVYSIHTFEDALIYYPYTVRAQGYFVDTVQEQGRAR